MSYLLYILTVFAHFSGRAVEGELRVCCRGISDMKEKDIKGTQWIKKDRTTERRIPPGGWIFVCLFVVTTGRSLVSGMLK